MTAKHTPALLVQLRRGNTVESEHLVDAVVATRTGPNHVWGNANRVILPRSAIKAVQALPLVTTGAAEHFGLTNEHLALACSSHNAEAGHLALVTSWFDLINGSVDWLECGPARPLRDETWLDVGPNITPLHNCCSGKHVGFLSVACHLGVEHSGYLRFDHPVQQLVTEAISQFSGLTLTESDAAIDGCGIPTFAMPLSSLALSMANLVDPADVGEEWAAACDRITSSTEEHPWWVSGTGRHEVFLSEVATQPLISKTGADGVFTAALPTQGLGIACKARDGARRASDAAITAVLAYLGVVPDEAVAQPVMNTLSETVGWISVAGTS